MSLGRRGFLRLLTASTVSVALYPKAILSGIGQVLPVPNRPPDIECLRLPLFGQPVMLAELGVWGAQESHAATQVRILRPHGALADTLFSFTVGPGGLVHWVACPGEELWTVPGRLLTIQTTQPVERLWASGSTEDGRHWFARSDDPRVLWL